MRTIVDIPDTQIKFLDKLSKEKHLSRAEIIRQALSDYINSIHETKETYKSAFGLWKNKNLDSIDYQSQIRSEWDK